jgi:hypothetical protein
MPDQSDPSEVLASFTLAKDNGVRIGSVIRVQLGSAAQLRGGPADRSPILHPALRVVGIVAAESEFPSGASPHYDLYATTAFAAAVNHRVALLSTYYVRFVHEGCSRPPTWSPRFPRCWPRDHIRPSCSGQSKSPQMLC